jgi:hypothetical protein
LGNEKCAMNFDGDTSWKKVTDTDANVYVLYSMLKEYSDVERTELVQDHSK